MKIKLEFMLLNVDTANKARKELLVASVQDKNICFLAKQNLSLGGLKLASAIEGTNSIHEGEKGILLGALLGLLGGIYVLYFPAWITVSPLWYTNSPWYIVLLVTTLFGAVSCAIGAALLGMSIFNTDLNQYKARINNGEILMIVAVPIYMTRRVRQIMSNV